MRHRAKRGTRRRRHQGRLPDASGERRSARRPSALTAAIAARARTRSVTAVVRSVVEAISSTGGAGYESPAGGCLSTTISAAWGNVHAAQHQPHQSSGTEGPDRDGDAAGRRPGSRPARSRQGRAPRGRGATTRRWTVRCRCTYGRRRRAWQPRVRPEGRESSMAPVEGTPNYRAPGPASSRRGRPRFSRGPAPRRRSPGGLPAHAAATADAGGIRPAPSGRAPATPPSGRPQRRRSGLPPRAEGPAR